MAQIVHRRVTVGINAEQWEWFWDRVAAAAAVNLFVRWCVRTWITARDGQRMSCSRVERYTAVLYVE